MLMFRALFLAALAFLAFSREARAEDEQLNQAARDRALTMRSFVISATRIDKSPWRYGTVAGLEVLTRASENDTEWLLDALQRGAAIEDQIIPQEWLPRPSVPYTVIIDNSDLSKIAVSQRRSQQIKFQSPEDSLTWGRWSRDVTTWGDRFESHDVDTYATNTDIYGVNKAAPVSFMSLYRALSCTPPLPGWLIEGLIGPQCGLFRDGLMPRVDISAGNRILGAHVAGTLWVTLDETERLAKDIVKEKRNKEFKATIHLLPLQRFFAEGPPPRDDQALWKSEAALFVRWGLMGPGRSDKQTFHAFLELVRRARTEPITEPVFTDCLGFGYDEMEKRLISLLKASLAEPTWVDLNISPDFDEVYLRKATVDQIGRILGDWLRMEGNAVHSSDPEESLEFLYSAGRMLERAYRDDNGLPPDVNPAEHFRSGLSSKENANTAATGTALVMKPFVVSSTHIHDPRLLSVYGMYEHDTGDDDTASELLTTAMDDGVIRPAAYIDLAEIRYAKATAKPLGKDGKIDAVQAASIMRPLTLALKDTPSPEPYWIIARTWEICDTRPREEDIELLSQGVRLFPRMTNITYRSALVCGRSGYVEMANRMIDGGRRFVTTEADLQAFDRLRSSFSNSSMTGTGR